LYKLTEKFKTAVSVKYQCPGEDMDPTALITVADDDDFAVGGAPVGAVSGATLWAASGIAAG
jgi:hypothetical protein